MVISNNDDMALGAIDACQDLGLTEEEMPVVVGVDATAPALEAVRQGTLCGTVRNDAAGIAESMLDLALALESGEDPAASLELTDGKYIWLPYQRVTLRELEAGRAGV